MFNSTRLQWRYKKCAGKERPAVLPPGIQWLSGWPKLHVDGDHPASGFGDQYDWEKYIQASACTKESRTAWRRNWDVRRRELGRPCMAPSAASLWVFPSTYCEWRCGSKVVKSSYYAFFHSRISITVRFRRTPRARVFKKYSASPLCEIGTTSEDDQESN